MNETVERLIRDLGSPDWSVRYDAARALGRIGGPEAVAALIKALQQDETELVRCAAARALGGIRTPEVVAALTLALGDEDDWVRSSAARALEGIRTPEVVAALTLALRDEYSWVRSVAARALGRGNPDVKQAITDGRVCGDC